MTDLAAMVRAFLHNAAARHWAVSRAEPESPSVDYRAGFAAGREAGEVAALALVLGSITGESATALIEEARAQAAVDSALPFDLYLEMLPAGDDAWDDAGDGARDDAGDGEVGAGPHPGAMAVPAPPSLAPADGVEHDMVPCPRCWLPADVLPPLPHDTNPRSRCPRGHENTLIPAVLEHLRSLMGPPMDQTG